MISCMMMHCLKILSLNQEEFMDGVYDEVEFSRFYIVTQTHVGCLKDNFVRFQNKLENGPKLT
jgi:hypothetical protein